MIRNNITIDLLLLLSMVNSMIYAKQNQCQVRMEMDDQGLFLFFINLLVQYLQS